ncbi:MAG: hypothetical protein WC346_21285 [Methanogenium sp.]|jgi:hypothetical protein
MIKHELLNQKVKYHDGRRKKIIVGTVIDTRPGSLLNINTMEEVKGISLKIKQENGKCIWTCAYPL